MRDDGAGFDSVFRANYGRVLAYCLRRAPEPAAHDATAEVFAVAWRRRDLPSAEFALPWLLATARRVLANQARAGRRRDRLVARLGASPPATATPPVGEAASDPVARALASLRPADRDLVLLAYWDELSHAEIAELLGLSVNAVGVRLHRARQRLRAELSDVVVDEEESTRCPPAT